jgi:hypothetical protein
VMVKYYFYTVATLLSHACNTLVMLL